MSTMSLVVMVCSKVSAVSSTVAMLGAPRSGSGSVHRSGTRTPRVCSRCAADRCGTPAPPDIIPIRHDGDVPHTLSRRPRRRARRAAGRPAAARHGIPHRRLPQRGPADRAGAARPHHGGRVRRLPDAGHARRRVARTAPRHRPGPRPRRAHACSTWAGAPARRPGRWPRPSRRWSGRPCSTARPTPWPSARGSGGTARRRWPAPPGRGRCSGRGVALPGRRPRGRQLRARRAGRAAARAGGRRGGGGGGAAGARGRAGHPARVRRGAGRALPAHRRGVAPARRPARRTAPARWRPAPGTGATSPCGWTAARCTGGSRAAGSATRTRSSPTCWRRARR